MSKNKNNIQYNIHNMVVLIIFMIAIMSGGLTPPVGGLLFITSSVENIALGKCIKPVIPFVLWVFLLMIIMCFVPGISTWIPTLVGYR